MNEWMNAVYQVARKEFLQHIRTKRLLIVGGAMVCFLGLVLFLIGPNFVKSLSSQLHASKMHQVLVLYFGIGLIGGLQFTQLLAIVLTADAVCSEWANRTIFLLLSKPVSRSAFVAGKFAGNVFTVTATLVVLFIATYILMMPLYSSTPSGDEFLGFLGMLGMIVLGCAAFAAMSLFFSTITKSTVTSLLLVLSLWLLVFPALGSIGLFSHMSQPGAQFSDAQVQTWLYLSPASDMQTGARLLVPDPADRNLISFAQHANPFGQAPDEVGIAALVLLAYTVLFVAASIAVVRRRNFE